MLSRINKTYYRLKPVIPRSLQLFLRRRLVRSQLKKYKSIWPIDYKAGSPPERWSGWPDGRKFALVLTHDVETKRGQDKCPQLIQLEKDLEFRSSFNFVPERYEVSGDLRQNLIDEGFEVGVHGLCHDGKYYTSRKIFRERALQINRYLKEWDASGYRAPSMLHKLDWFHDLNIEYDASTFDTDPFEPQPEGMGTIFPFMVNGGPGGKSYVEIPYTLPQDFTLFSLMKEQNISIWKKKVDWIAERGGMALMTTHPDYMRFDGTKKSAEEYPAEYYRNFLEYIKEKYRRQYWNVLPKEIALFWRDNYGARRG